MIIAYIKKSISNNLEDFSINQSPNSSISKNYQSLCDCPQAQIESIGNQECPVPKQPPSVQSCAKQIGPGEWTLKTCSKAQNKEYNEQINI